MGCVSSKSASATRFPRRRSDAAYESEFSSWSKEGGFADGNPNNMLRIQVLSDLHLEGLFQHRWETMLDFPVTAPYLVLAGDIGVLGTEKGTAKYRFFLLHQAHRFEHVFVVAGNHEYYLGEVGKVDEAIQEICDERDNLHFLQMDSFKIPGTDVRLLGATMWTHVSTSKALNLEMLVNDYKRILIAENKQLRVKDTNRLHSRHKDWLKAEIASAKEAGERVVVVSHHAPTERANNPAEGKFLAAMCSNLEKLMRDPVDAWIFGHTHWCFDERVKHTRCVANCKGYVSEATAWDPGFRIEVKKRKRSHRSKRR